MSETPVVPAEHVVDPRLGIVTLIESRTLHAELPAALAVCAAHIAGLRAGAATPGGAAWFSPERARASALGEAVERHAAIEPPVRRRATAQELHRERIDHLDPVDLAVHRPQDRAAAGFPFAAPARDRAISWSRGVDLASGDPTLVPTSHVALGLVAHEPVTHVPLNAGIAAAHGRTAGRDASLAALEEVLERDAVTTAWMWDLRWPRRTTPAWLAEVLGGTGGAYEVNVHDVPNRWGLPVSAVLLAHRDGSVIGLGTALRPSRAAAIEKAAAEAVVSVHAAHELDAEPSGEAGAVSVALRPWRADRRYADDYRSDWRDVTDVFCHVQIYLDPRMRVAALERLASGMQAPVGWRGSDDIADRAGYIEIVRRAGGNAYTVDLTTPDLARAGWAAARCVVPGARSSAPAAFGQLGGASPAPHLGEPTCLLPLPHA